VADLGLPAELLARVRPVAHDGHDPSLMVELGSTRRGTPVRVNRCLTEVDLVVATGRIKPHYFAGFGAGAKAIFPGLGENASIRTNHRLKEDAGARPGIVDGNPCREDIEEAVGLLPTPAFLVNCVLDADGRAVAAVAGEVRAAFRAGAELTRPLYRVRAPRSAAVVVSDELPLTASLYQASKLAAAAAELLEPGGTIVIAAECGDGVGGIDVVNRAIYDIGIRPRLPVGHRVVLVSAIPRDIVEQTYCAWAPSVEAALAGIDAHPTVLPRAGDALVEVIA
jgi:nickel-dependent lactate racemase